MTRVLVTDGEQRSTLAVVRSLGSAGHEVAVTSTGRRPLAGASRFCATAYPVPAPADGGDAFAEGVAAAVRDFEAGVIIPMTDVSIPLILNAASRFEKCEIPLPSAETHARVSDKVALLGVAESLGVPVPEQRVFTAPPSRSELESCDAGFPLILKPARSAVHSEGGTVRLTVRTAHSFDEAHRIFGQFPREAYPVLAQRRIIGPGLGIFLLAWEGRTLASFAHRRIREKPPTGGVSVYREAVAVRPDLLEYSKRLLEHFDWRGVAMVEFKEESATGIPYLMEINGRFWGSLQLAIDSGVNFPRMLLDCVRGETGIASPVTRLGVRSRWLWGEVDHLLAIWRMPASKRRGHPELPSRLSATARFLVPWRPGDRFEVLRVGDPGPFLRESVTWFRALGGK